VTAQTSTMISGLVFLFLVVLMGWHFRKTRKGQEDEDSRAHKGG